jgi:hypothetical protein
MAKNWAIAIGINQYQFFQPLGCAQADAEALNNYLVTEAGFLPQHSLLMTDTSPLFGDRATYPTKDNILLLFEDLAAACWQPQDRLWLFFSGYGVNYKGQDYLMPIEGNPERVMETGIELRSLLQTLQVAALNVLVLLDINRAFGSQADAPVGQETIELARELQIPTIISCQPEQFSRESSELGNGFFTAALLEALRSGRSSNLADLQTYLGVRVPELCQHYWRPAQNPVAVMASKDILLPSVTPIAPQPQPSESFTSLAAPKLEQPRTTKGEEGKRGGDLAAPKLEQPRTTPPSEAPEKLSANTSKNQDIWEANVGIKEAPISFPPSFPPLITTPQDDSASDSREEKPAKPLFGQQLIVWGGSTILLLSLVVIVFLRNQAGFRVDPPTSQQDTDDTTMTTALPDAPPLPQVEPAAPPRQLDSQTANDSKLQQQNQKLLESAKKSVKANQATSLSQAIATLKQIQPTEPLYTEAQQNIQTLSSTMFNLAESRAQQGQYQSAIATATLIKSDEPLYTQAQGAIKQWRLDAKQYVGNKTVLDAANGLIDPRQASSYNRAIEVAKRVPPGEPGSDLAEKSINKWSERIFQIATTRASSGDLKAAIATANLVPEGTSAYSKARNAIQKWQK